MKKNDCKWLVKGILSHILPNIVFIFFAKNRDLIVRTDTDIVVEGYPRSGNTYLVALLMSSSKRTLKIARHRHEIGQIRFAIRNKIPIVIVVRKPLDSAVSFVLRENVSLNFALRYYKYFYGWIMKQNLEKITLFDFSQVTEQQTFVLEKVGHLLEKSCISSDYSDEQEEEVRERVKKMELLDSGKQEIRSSHLALPSSRRGEKSQSIKASINTKDRQLLAECDRIYQNLFRIAKNESSIGS